MSKPIVAAVAATALAGCSAAMHQAEGGTPMLPYMREAVALHQLAGSGAGKISHVVFIIQENRSFDNLFQGYPGADTVPSGKNSLGQTLKLKPYPLKGPRYNIEHDAQAMFAACDGTGTLPGTDCKMDGFNLENGPPLIGPENPQAYVYVPHRDSAPYFAMAHEWVVADKNFASQLDESFVAHQYVIAAQADWSVNLPTVEWGCGAGKTNTVATITKTRAIDGPPIHPCYDYLTLGDELDKANLSWRFYAAEFGKGGSGAGANWSAYRAVRHIRYGPDWKKVISPSWHFITDVRAGKLANFTWITPLCSDSDHVNCGGGYGPSWVATLVNTVGRSKIWNSTAIFVIWDDWGGMYDHVPPPYKGRDGLGFRTPLLVISPYAKQNYVSHVQYETASVLRFAEDLFGLGQLSGADKRATSPAADCFDFAKPPRPFERIDAPLGAPFFMKQRSEYQIPDYE